MTIRKIVKTSGASPVGRMGSPKQPLSRHREITELLVFPGQGIHGRDVTLSVQCGTAPIFYTHLGPNAAMEVVKGILQNLPDFFVAADDEFLSIVAAIQKRSKEDSQAIISCIRERAGTSPAPHLTEEEKKECEEEWGGEEVEKGNPPSETFPLTDDEKTAAEIAKEKRSGGGKK